MTKADKVIARMRSNPAIGGLRIWKPWLTGTALIIANPAPVM